MNSEPEEDNESAAFAEHLATFSSAPLPDDWKEDLITNATSPDCTDSSSFTTFHKISFTLIGACWILIAALTLTTPSNESTTELASPEPNIATSDQIPLLVEYFQNRQSLTEFF